MEIFARGHQISNLNQGGQLGQALCQVTVTQKILKIYFFTFRVFLGKADNHIVVFRMYYKPTNFYQIHWSHFEKIEIVIFLCELPLILRVSQKQKYGLEMFGRGPYISNLNEIDQLVQVLNQETEKNLKYIFPVSGIFPGKADGVIVLGFEYNINSQHLIKIVKAIFEKI